MKKAKSIFLFISSIVVIFFFTLYLSIQTGYYKTANSNKSTLTEEALKRFEEDVANGKEIQANNYLIKEKNYNNKASILGMKVSKIIEKLFNKGMNAFFREIDKTIHS